jgi:hypothetical protein
MAAAATSGPSTIPSVDPVPIFSSVPIVGPVPTVGLVPTIVTNAEILDLSLVLGHLGLQTP